MEFRVDLVDMDVRDICIERGWYTCGDNKSYSAMLSKCDDDMTVDEVAAIAKDIIEHSNEEAMNEVRRDYPDNSLTIAVMGILLIYATPRVVEA